MHTLITLAVYVWSTALFSVASAQTSCQGDDCLRNPLAFSGIADLVSALLELLVIIALPIISLFVVYAGFRFLTAQGNRDKLGDAKQNLLYVIIGAILILGAWALAQLLGGTVEQLRP